MKYMGMPVALWAVFTRSFRKNLETCFGLNATEAKEVTRKAKVQGNVRSITAVELFHRIRDRRIDRCIVGKDAGNHFSGCSGF